MNVNSILLTFVLIVRVFVGNAMVIDEKEEIERAD